MIPLSQEEMSRLRRREAEILERIGRLKKAMNETVEFDTLAFKSELFKKAQDELRRVQDKISGITEE